MTQTAFTYGNALYDLASAMRGDAVLLDAAVARRELGEYGDKLIGTLEDAARDLGERLEARDRRRKRMEKLTGIFGKKTASEAGAK